MIVSKFLGWGKPDSTLLVVRSLMKANPNYVPSLLIYNRLIDQLCRICRLDEGHRLVYDMRFRGHCVNVVSFTTLIGGYCKIGDLVSAQKMFDEMPKWGIWPNSLTYSVLVCGFLRKREIGRGKELMGEMWQVMNDEVDEDKDSTRSAAFSNVIDSLCVEGLFNELFVIAENMPQGKSVAEEFAYAQMIDSLSKVGRCNGAARVVYIMRKKGFNPSLVSYNSIVHGLSKEGSCMRAYQLLEEGSDFGYYPSEYTYKVLVESLCRENDISKGKGILQLMLTKGIDKTRIYNIYLRALCFSNNPTELLNVLVSMFQTQCQPDIITLNTVINGFCKMGKIEEALKVLDDMLMGKFSEPDVVTFTTVISCLLSIGRVEEAQVLLNKVMPEKGIRPGVVTYNAVLRGLFKQRMPDKAMEVFSKMTSDYVAADSVTYAIIIEGLCESNLIKSFKIFWDDVIWPSKVHDCHVYAAILKGFCRSGKFNEACDFLYELVDCGVNLNIVNYNIVIDSACKLGLKKEAYQIVGEMRKNGLVPDSITWRILEKLHGNFRKQENYGAKNLQFVEDFEEPRC